MKTTAPLLLLILSLLAVLMCPSEAGILGGYGRYGPSYGYYPRPYPSVSYVRPVYGYQPYGIGYSYSEFNSGYASGYGTGYSPYYSYGTYG